MGQKRTIVLDEDELIMIVGKEVVEQIDENRGEMNRTEFVNLLIQSQLKKFNEEHDYVTKKEFNGFTQEVKEILHNYLELALGYALSTDETPSNSALEDLNRQLMSNDNPDDKDAFSSY